MAAAAPEAALSRESQEAVSGSMTGDLSCLWGTSKTHLPLPQMVLGHRRQLRGRVWWRLSRRSRGLSPELGRTHGTRAYTGAEGRAFSWSTPMSPTDFTACYPGPRCSEHRKLTSRVSFSWVSSTENAFLRVLDSCPLPKAGRPVLSKRAAEVGPWAERKLSLPPHASP